MLSPRRRNNSAKSDVVDFHDISNVTDNRDQRETKVKKAIKSSSYSNNTMLHKSIDQARKTGKLHISNMNLTLPLPDELFDLKKSLTKLYDGSMDMDSEDKFWSCYGEDMITSLDLSENDFSSADNRKEYDLGHNISSTIVSVLDERIGCYKALETLYVRNCYLDDLPWKVMSSNLLSLKVLDARGNKFTQVPLKDLSSSIRKLLLAENHIQSLGDYYDCIDLPHLQYMDISDNALNLLPSELKCPKLQCLLLAKNQIEYISLGFLESLQSSLKILDLSDNKLSLNIDFSQHEKLEILELGRNKLKDSPRIHYNLIRLGLNFNEVSSIENLFGGQMDENGKSLHDSEEWFRSNLTELHLEQNRLEKTLHPPTLAVMTNLKLLDISHNALETIPHEVGYLRNLNKVILDGNPFRMIRSAISYKKNGSIDTAKLLKSLRNKGDPPSGPGYYGSVYEGKETRKLMDTPQSVTEARNIVRDALSNNQVLNIGGRGLSGELLWPELVDELSAKSKIKLQDQTIPYGSQIKTWIFSNGKLSALGNDWIKVLPNIKTLEGKRNRINCLPSNFSELSLEVLNLAQNCITTSTLRESICNSGSNLASSLVTLDLSNNEIEHVPECLFEFSRLVSVNLSYNKIKTLEWIIDDSNEGKNGTGWKHGLVSLEHLDLSNNAIHDLGYLPLALSGCKYLRTLLLNNNAIYHIPLELGLLEQLSTIDLLGNTQRKIPVRVLTQSCSKILHYLRQRMTPEEIHEAKENHQEIDLALQEENLLVRVSSQDSASLSQMHSEDKDNSELVDEVEEAQKYHMDLVMMDQCEKGDDNRSNIQLHSKDGTSQKMCGNSSSTEIQKIETKESIMTSISELKQSILDLCSRLDNLSISQAQRLALKRELAMQRSRLRREEKKLDG